jgi:low temperature requirement protein LtrA
VIRQIGPERAAGRADEEQRATNVELFFDLVFVCAITQFATLLKDDLSFAGAARVLFLLLVLWWAWIYSFLSVDQPVA